MFERDASSRTPPSDGAKIQPFLQQQPRS